MHVNPSLAVSTMFGFLLVLARVAGAFIFVPLPGMKNTSDTARIVMTLAITIALFSAWPEVNGLDRSLAKLIGYVLLEAALGITIGLMVAFLSESLLIAAQVMGLQAGYGYASVVDPNTQADASVLLVLAQLFGGMLFFSMGFDRDVLRAFASSLKSWPPGTFAVSIPMAEAFIKLGSTMFSTGLRLAFPVIALLLLVDLALALLGRVNAQLQLLTLAFPIKMLLALALLAWIVALYPTVFGSYGRETMTLLERLTHS